MTSRDQRPRVAVFDASLPPALAFIRSLGRRGIPVVACDPRRHASGRYSRFASSFARCPDPTRTDAFVSWLEDHADRGLFDLVAPTSDYLTFAVAELDERRGSDLSGGVGGARGADAVRDCLFKDRFAHRMTEVGFPVPVWAAPTSVDEAAKYAAEIGYPVVLKPRSHIGVGVERGAVVTNEDELRRVFRPYPLDPHQSLAVRHDPDLAYPLLQRLIVGDGLECVSITGFIDRCGDVVAVNCSRNLDRWGDGLAIGTLFDTPAPPAFLDRALDAVRTILGCGIFELEVLVDRSTGAYFAIDLNPRGFGQMALDIARGDDLPLHWYHSSRRAGTSADPVVHRRPPRRLPTHWRMGVPFVAGVATRLLRGPARVSHARGLRGLVSQPTVGAMHSRTDPLPSLVLGAWMLRHPRALIRPFLDADRQARPSTVPTSVPTLGKVSKQQNTVTPGDAGEHGRSASPIVSVIVPTFRRERGLREAMDSVLAEGIESFELIVVDDSPEQSARSTVEAVKDPRVRHVANPSPSGGCPAKVRNLGIELAAGRYLYFLDDDDRVVAGGLTALITALEANPHRGVAFGTVRCVGPDETIRATYERWFGWAARQGRRFARSSLLTAGLIMFRGTVIINSCCVIRADCARRLGGYDSSIPVYEDVEFFTRGIRAFGHVFVDVPVLSYTTGEPSIINDLDGDWTPVQRSYALMHGKYKEAYGPLDYRLLQVASKLMPAGRAV